MTPALSGLSSMATRDLLGELAASYHRAHGVAVNIESVGGVDAARRVASGEAVDVVVLAADAIERLAAAGHLRADSRTDLARSGVAIAVRAGAPRPDVSTPDALREAVLRARTLGLSTGPSGDALRALFDRWGLGDTLRARVIQAPPGVPAGALLAHGEVELGFQQRSELIGLDGIDLIGPMPPGLEIVTVFAAACATTSSRPDAVRALLAYLRSPAAAEAVTRHGMTPV